MFGRKRGRGFAAAQGGPAPQRARAGAGGVGRAIAASMYYRRKYPGWGRVYIPPNSELDAVGATWATATPAQRATRQRMHMHGHGAYNYGRAALRFGARYLPQVGRAMGAATGMAGAAELGGHAGAFVRKQIMGSGAYNTNSLVNHDPSSMGVASFASSADETGALHICHEEYIQDVLGTTPFDNNAYPINPGDPALFPWLSQIAQNYDEYEFSGLVFTYKTVSSDTTVVSGASSNLGTVIMACNYNAAAAPFTTKQQMMEYDGAARVKISEDLVFGIECDKSKIALSNHLFVAPNGSVPAGEDVKTYFHGLFQIATNQTAAAAGQIGELWVSYKVTLRKPKLGTGSGVPLPISGVKLTDSVVQTYYNNLEDVDYKATSVLTSKQVQAGSIVTNVGIGVDGDDFVDGYYGWNTSVTNDLATFPNQSNPSTARITYVFPPWLQQGDYEFTIQTRHGLAFTRTGGATDVFPDLNVNAVLGTSAGVTVRSFSGIDQCTNIAESAANHSVSGIVTVNTSQQSSGEVQWFQVAVFYSVTAIAFPATQSIKCFPTFAGTQLFSLSLTNPLLAASSTTLSNAIIIAQPRFGARFIGPPTAQLPCVGGQPSLKPQISQTSTTQTIVLNNMRVNKNYLVVIRCHGGSAPTGYSVAGVGATITNNMASTVSGTSSLASFCTNATSGLNTTTVTFTGTVMNLGLLDFVIQEVEFN